MDLQVVPVIEKPATARVEAQRDTRFRPVTVKANAAASLAPNEKAFLGVWVQSE